MPIAKLEDININYRVEGTGDPLVMIMGFGSNMDGWHYQIPFFSRHYRVVVFDNRGVGGSDKPKGPYSTRMMADDAVHLMDYLDIGRAHVMGASMGGMIAQELAINHPERVNRLVFACTYARPELGVGAEGGTLSGSPEKRMARIVSLAFNKQSSRLVYGTFVQLRSIRPGSSLAVGIEGQTAALIGHDTLDRLGSITAKTLVIVGTGDRLIDPAASAIITSKMPNANLVKIDGGSHTFMIENRDKFNREVLKFLTG